MSAVNTFTDNRYAYLSTDGGYWDCETGALNQEGAKTICFPTLALVLGLSGRVPPPALFAAMEREHSLMTPATQRSIMAAVLPAMRKARADLKREKRAERLGLNCIGVWAALYDHETGTPHLLHADSTNFPGHRDREAYQWNEGGYAMPALTAADQASIMPKGYPERPRDEMAAMLALQRRKTVQSVAGGCGVGATCYFYRVGPDGVSHEPLMTFPDTVGAAADPSAVATILPGAMSGMRAV